MGRKNKKLFVIGVIAIFVSVNSCFALEGLLIDSSHEYRTMDYPGLRVGEKMKYKVAWKYKGIKVINVGYGELHVKELLSVNGRDVYHVVFKAWTSTFFDIFFKIRDVYESYIDRAGCFSWGLEMDIREGKSHYTRETRFNQGEHYGLHKSSYKKNTRRAPILPYMQDFVSAMYYARAFDMEKEKEISFNMDNDGKAYKTTLKFVKREIIKTKMGRIDAVKLDLSWYKLGRKKRKSKESHFLWISADGDRLPLKIESIGEIGKFITSLIRVYDRGKR